MKTAKSYKILILLIVFALSLMAGFGFMIPKTASAEGSKITLSEYFSGQYRNAEFKDNNLVFTVRAEEQIKIKNQLVLDDLGIKFTGEFDKIKSLKMSVESNSYYTNGNKQADGSFSTTVSNEIVLVDENSALANGDVLSVKLSVDNGFLGYELGTEPVKYLDSDQAKIGAMDKYLGKITFDIVLEAGNETASFALVSVNQKASDGEDSPFNQTFKKDAQGEVVVAYPRVNISDNFFSKNRVAGEMNVVNNGESYNLSTTVHALFDNEYPNSSIFVSDNFTAENQNVGTLGTSSKSSKTVVFYKNIDATEDVMTFGIGSTKISTKDVVFETYKVKVINDEKNAPVYNWDELAIESYIEKLNDLITKDYGEDGVHSIRLGETVTLPSMKDLVTDDSTSYENLTFTLHYNTPSVQGGTSSTMRLKLDEAGDYEFLVAFKDKAGNTMEKSDFYEADKDDAEVLVGSKYYGDPVVNGLVTSYGYVFRFRVEDDAPIYIQAPSSQVNGYLNTKYIAKDFDVKASENKVEYKLFYNESADIKVDNATDLSAWKQIASTDEIKKSSFVAKDFTKEQLTDIGYDGKVSFTPTAKGTYVLECAITSGTVAGREQRAISVIRVNQEPTAVEYDSHWLENNVWSVVFLSIGTICLIGIVVLLCIKPKANDED